MKPLEIKTTERGFEYAEFVDRYGQKCSLQKSSLATEDAIWFGVDVDLNGEEVNARMHLTQEMVEQLLPILSSFYSSGNLI